MRIVMTLIARDDADLLDAQLSFHLNAGVDIVLVAPRQLGEATRAALARYEGDGSVRVRQEGRDTTSDADLTTAMARSAATDHHADWVINGAAGEFWWPRGRDLESVLDAIPSRYGVVQGVVRPFLPSGRDDGSFAERMTRRLAPAAPIADPASPWHPSTKVVHRGDPRVVVARDGATVDGDLLPLRGWYPIEVLRFPTNPVTDEALAPAADDAAEEPENESLVLDTRVRDMLRALRDPSRTSGGASRLPFPMPSIADDAAYAVDVAVLGEADVLSARREIDDLGRRLTALEKRPGHRLSRGVSRLGGLFSTNGTR